MGTITNWVLRHRLLTAASWIIVALIGLAGSGRATASLSQKGGLSAGYEGADTNSSIARRYGTGGSTAALVPVIVLPRGVTVLTPGIRARLAVAFAAVQDALPGARVASYASTGDMAFVSADGHTTFALVYAEPRPGSRMSAPPVAQVAQALAAHPIAGARVFVTGREALASWSNGGGSGVLTETLIGGLGALIILILVFGSFLAVVPLLMAMVAIPTTFLLVWGLTRITEISFIVEFLIALIGLGVSIDYSLLIVTRWRGERAQGHENAEAVRRAMATAGRAVVFSGTTVGISLLALVALPVPFLRSVGYGGLLIPLVSMIVTCTLLPVVLSSLGPALDHPRRRHADRPSRLWAAWARAVVRQRWLAAGVATLLLGALLLPLSGLALGNPSPQALATSGPAYLGLRALDSAGIGAGALDPIEVLSTPRDAATLARQLGRVPGVLGAVAPSGASWRRGGSALLRCSLPTTAPRLRAAPPWSGCVGTAHAGPHPCAGGRRGG